MHAFLGDYRVGEAPIGHIAKQSPATLRAVEQTPYRPTSYQAATGRWPAIVVVLAGHAALLAVLASIGMVQVIQPEREALVVTAIAIPDEPEPVPMEMIETAPVKQSPPPIVAPPPVVAMPLPPASVLRAEPAAPPPVVTPKAAVAPPAPAGPVSAANLATTMISARPPKYPIESRRKREQGTVVLTVLVGTSGTVEQAAIAKTSGFDRLDKAALEAVRRWRWSPALRDGQPVRVKGYVDIPFILSA